MKNPIKSGYFLKFSQSEFNAENMVYILEIDRFKDIVRDGDAWSEDISYKVIDASIPDFGTTRMEEKDLHFYGGSEDEWPSKRIPCSSLIDHVKFIWRTYLANSATTQICMPARVLSNTIQRLRYLHLYGHKVFDETLIDPTKTLNADVLPRFLTSTYHKAMTSRLQALYPLPPRDQLVLRSPKNSECMNWDEDRLTTDNLRELPMKQLFHDKTLYEEFLKYSKKIYSEENVYLARAIAIYRAMYSSADEAIIKAGKVPPDAENHAWLIFRFFICPNSIYECGMNQHRCKDIMHNLAHPTKDMFSSLEKSVHRLIRNQYVNFSFTREFRAIPAAIIGAAFDQQLKERAERLTREREKMERERKQKEIESQCFGLGRYVHGQEDNPNRREREKIESRTYPNSEYNLV